MSDRACGSLGGSLAKAMKKINYSGYRFPPEIVQQAIWLYLRFTLSFRDVEDLLAERRIAISYETVRRWVNHFVPMIAATCANAVQGPARSNPRGSRSMGCGLIVVGVGRPTLKTKRHIRS